MQKMLINTLNLCLTKVNLIVMQLQIQNMTQIPKVNQMHTHNHKCQVNCTSQFWRMFWSKRDLKKAQEEMWRTYLLTFLTYIDSWVVVEKWHCPFRIIPSGLHHGFSFSDLGFRHWTKQMSTQKGTLQQVWTYIVEYWSNYWPFYFGNLVNVKF